MYNEHTFVPTPTHQISIKSIIIIKSMDKGKIDGALHETLLQ